jgi:Rrf2 family protein
MADIAMLGVDNEPVPLREVASRQSISKLYLSQLTISLKNSGLLRSVWGNKGGYILGRPAAEIRLLDIVEAIDGPVFVLGCLDSTLDCPRFDQNPDFVVEHCECRDVWMEINEGIVKTLATRTLADVVAKKNRTRNAP